MTPKTLSSTPLGLIRNVIKNRSIFLVITALCLVVLAPSLLAQSGSISVEGVVDAPAPDAPAIITSPDDDDEFTISPIQIKGTCLSGTVVEIYKNGVFAGSTVCDDNGRFILQLDLLIGKNTLIAKIRDNLGQYGPDSESVTVSYSPFATEDDDDVVIDSTGQLLLLIDTEYRGKFPGDSLTIEPQIIGGEAPYAIEIEWGDGQANLVARQNTGSFKINHTYHEAGIKIIKLTATDVNKQKAYIQTVAIINGTPKTIAQATNDKKDRKKVELKLFTPLQAVVSGFSVISGGAIIATFFVRRHYIKKIEEIMHTGGAENTTRR